MILGSGSKQRPATSAKVVGIPSRGAASRFIPSSRGTVAKHLSADVSAVAAAHEPRFAVKSSSRAAVMPDQISDADSTTSAAYSYYRHVKVAFGPRLYGGGDEVHHRSTPD